MIINDTDCDTVVLISPTWGWYEIPDILYISSINDWVQHKNSIWRISQELQAQHLKLESKIKKSLLFDHTHFCYHVTRPPT